MAYFEGVGGSGGSIVVTCDSEFAGSTISCSDGTNTMTAVCPSVSPYEVEFMVSDSGTYEISATVSGTTYTTEVVVDLELEAALEYGFAWRRWVTYGGLDPTDYEGLADVFSDEATVRRLMTVHASADYLITCVTDDIDTIDDFTANDTAMKWIGLRDYVCDGLTAITGVEDKFLASEYWERYLKDHVPTMTSNSAPYGTVSASTADNSYPAWKAFDGDSSTGWMGTTGGTSTGAHSDSIQYMFTNPICVKKIMLVPTNTSSSNRRTDKIRFYGSNDNSTWIPLTEEITPDLSTTAEYIEVEDSDYYLYYKAIVTSNNYQAALRELQFYGRSLNVSVPVMTSNTAPYGTAIKSAELSSGYAAWKAFDGDSSTLWNAQDGNASNIWIGYDFGTTKVNVNKINALIDTTAVTSMTAKVQGSNTGNVDDWHDVSELYSFESSWGTSGLEIFLDLNEGYSKYRLFIPTFTVSNQSAGAGRVKALQFYGVDYSEKEFEPNTTKKWLYDHGVELETLLITGNGEVTKENNYIILDSTSSNKAAGVYKTIDLTPFSALCGIFESIAGYTVGSSDPPSFFIRVGTVGGTTDATSQKSGLTFTTKMYLDISSFNETKDVIILSYNEKSSLDEFWLE